MHSSQRTVFTLLLLTGAFLARLSSAVPILPSSDITDILKDSTDAPHPLPGGAARLATDTAAVLPTPPAAATPPPPPAPVAGAPAAVAPAPAPAPAGTPPPPAAAAGVAPAPAPGTAPPPGAPVPAGTPPSIAPGPVPAGVVPPGSVVLAPNTTQYPVNPDPFAPSVTTDCWKFSSFTPTTVAGFGGREGVFAFAVEEERRLFVIGGCGTGQQSADCPKQLPTLNLVSNSWESVLITLNSNAALATPVGAAYAYNKFSHRVYEFGGTRNDGSTGAQLTNTFAITYEDSSTGRWLWKVPDVSGDVPPPSQDATLVTFGVSVVLFGGYDVNTFFNKVYYINSSGNNAFTWTQPLIAGAALAPSPRAGLSATRWRDSILYFGGTDGKTSYNDLHVLRVPANRFNDAWEWTLVTPIDTRFAPPRLAYHSATLVSSAQGDRLLILGGFDPTAEGGPVYYNGLYILDLGSMKWLQPPASLPKGITPKAIRRHGQFALGDSVMFFGGCGPGSMAQRACNPIEKPLVLDMNAVCENSCKHGRYHFNDTDQLGSCICEPSFQGKFCEIPVSCPKDCSKRGTCDKGVCKCDLGYGGDDCSQSVCPNDCNKLTGRGQCSQTEQRCLCAVGFWGLDCSQDNCPNNCLGRGDCQLIDRTANNRSINTCKCDEGFSLDDCSGWGYSTYNGTNSPSPLVSVHVGGYEPGFTCPNHCSGHGRCLRVEGVGPTIGGRCKCNPGFGGRDCSGECTHHCGAPLRGNCVGVDSETVKCQCKEGYTGPGCQQQYCARNCSGRGLCSNNACWCSPGWSGAACEIDTMCSGHGEFVENHCKCHANWGGKDCSQPVSCKGACSGNGVCMGTEGDDDTKVVSGFCVCATGWKGSACDEKDCPLGCSNHGVCNSNGLCSCYSGYAGAGCERTLECPNNCTGTHGFCHPHSDAPLSKRGQCLCAPEWAGEDCNSIGCPSDCHGYGTCMDGHCKCNNGHSGKNCEIACPNECSGNGFCTDGGVCECKPGSAGLDCSEVAKCPGHDSPLGECTSHGVCFKAVGECLCAPGWTGPDCGKSSQCGEQQCGQHGNCTNGKCYCEPGYEGEHCERKATCPDDCHGRGICQYGKCFCNAGFEGMSCEIFHKDDTCPKNCSGHGLCQYGRCFCAEGYSGNDCALPGAGARCMKTPFSKLQCEGHGTCAFARCFCHPGYGGEFCEKNEICPGGCVAGQGICMLGKCHCLPNFKGPDCSEDIVCEGTPLPCSGHGICVQGSCACEPGFSGNACERGPKSSVECPNNCTNGGVCHMGKCFCVEGRDGKDCSIKLQDACLYGCSNKGVCRFGQCFCKPGYVGRGCEIEVKCSAKCLVNGVCAYGHCFCVSGWEGKDCDVPVTRDRQLKALEEDLASAYAVSKAGAAQLNLNYSDSHFCEGGCNMHGTCVNNQCWCDAGYVGSNCQYVQAGAVGTRCPNNCNNNGRCLFGKCMCDIGWGGRFCEESTPLQCPGNCNDKGICHYGFCHCRPGYKGNDCSQRETCDKECEASQRGICVAGVCQCVAGFKGRNCEQKIDTFATAKFREVAPTAHLPALPMPESACPTSCGPHGVCFKEQCFCAQGFAGADCSLKAVLPTSEAHALTPSEHSSTTPIPSSSSSPHPFSSMSVATSTSAALSAESHVSYVLLGMICFAAGVVACLGAQVAWDRYQKHKRQRATQAILTPLLHTLDQ
uniref:Predicted protein n=1 Tax=Hordeum vulgare subsp. vulgare TaxID=112509 RepID=F2DG52_HORVV|nr:predicted protein [Hordeum vulgare subsp. vulgare]